MDQMTSVAVQVEKGVRSWLPADRANRSAALSKAEYRTDVDGLRTVAVLSVLAYHVGITALTGGFLGVDVFFVISGYLITKKIKIAVSRGEFTVLGFWAGRYRRLFPALAATLFLSLVAAYFIFPPEYLAQFGASITAAIPGLSNFYFWSVAGYFDTAAITKPALHTWSLAVEEQFYFFWPIILAPLLRWKAAYGPWAVGMIGVASLLSVALFLSFGSRISHDPGSAVFYLLPFRAYELALGASVVWCEAIRPKARPLREFIAATGLAAVIIPMFLFTARTPLVPAVLPCVGTALLIWVGKGPLSARIFDNGPSAWVGKLSYSIYLVHWPIIVFWSYLFDTSGGTAKLAMCAAAVVLAIGLYYGVERPIHLGHTLAGRARFFAVMCPAAALLAAMGTSAWTSKGWLWRYEPEIAGLLDPANTSLGLPPVPYRCFLSESDNWSALDKRCYVPIEDGKPNIMLVGDSTAAALYPGLKAALGSTANLYLWSGSACVPALDAPRPDRPNCPPSNDQFFRKTINEHRYNLVILSGHGGYPEMRQGFPAIKAALNRIGTPFILLGDFPTYADIPLNIVARHGKLEGLDDIMAANLADGCTEEHGRDQLVDPSEFFSTKAAFCTDGRAAYHDGIHLYQQDWFHLTQAGAFFLAGKLMPAIKAKISRM
ncbi:acyltransferase family protein [Mesorhizobium sp. M2A.F.Ca.ET.039.01.1.1]|uniref:acyltransferase family protein n=1 Tax=Mesorhizobium sp. M2A.F.Ca.ET.039.01.1.1 TaxID=2496746 RepID=UPI000FC9CB38|nr:acyltransferase family protein [Mesorhizobium sp. M2A.F.Ca.ET.039.01.1.1]RWX71884.1 acyltransferase [Mesorhizobium sp. M2A.F.Ca.ET.039.01.1.1]TIV48078.1 MAG: acyltransferase [Mesorhizobium sp.]